MSLAVSTPSWAVDRLIADGGFIDQVRADFRRWDTNHDRALSAAEIERALADPAVRGSSAAAAATLRRAVSDNSAEPITLAAVVAAVVERSASRRGALPPLDAVYRSALRTIADTRRQLFVPGSPRLDTVSQGRLGDCFVLASVGAMAFGQPDRLRQMVAERPDGSLSIHLGTGQTVVVSYPTDGEIAVAASSPADGVWAAVFEKAIGQVLLDRQPNHAEFVSPFQIIDMGGRPNVSLGILTGHRCRRIGCEDFQRPGTLVGTVRDARLAGVRDALGAAFRSGKRVVGGTADVNAGPANVPGLFYDHSYAVLGYDRPTDRVSFWNPMGNTFRPAGPPGLAYGYPTAHGRFDCPLPEAVMWFGSFAVETDDPFAW